MQAGDTITGKLGTRYLIIKSLGQPGLFGQAFLCHQQPDDTPVVIKTLRRDRVSNPADRDRFFAEARTLEAVAKVEEQRKVHYAVRLLDESPDDATEPFIVMEQATGQNVLQDVLEKVVSWDHAPLEEQRALAIAYYFARALSCAHQAGFCYDDMKLDNLFWREDNPNDPLRIIDWNVTSKVAERRGVAGDWKRFGARLYEMRTGKAIGISRDDVVLGERPAGPRWERLPIGIRDIIEKALAGSYQNDEVILSDMGREWQQARMGWSELIGKATAADGEGKVIEVLAPVWRAEQKLNAMDRNAPEREPNLKRCAELRERAETRQGIASNQALETAIGMMGRGSYGIAKDEFSKIYHNTGKQDPRPRRWFWLSQMAIEKPEFYRKHQKDLVAIVEALHKGDKGAMQTAYQSLALVPIDQIPISWLHEEFFIIAHTQERKFDAALKRFENLQTLFNDYPDLKGWKAELEQRRDDLRKQEEARKREQDLLSLLTEYCEQSQEMAKKNNWDEAKKNHDKAMGTLRLLAGCSSEASIKASELKQQLDKIQIAILSGKKKQEEEHAAMLEQMLSTHPPQPGNGANGSTKPAKSVAQPDNFRKFVLVVIVLVIIVIVFGIDVLKGSITGSQNPTSTLATATPAVDTDTPTPRYTPTASPVPVPIRSVSPNTLDFHHELKNAWLTFETETTLPNNPTIQFRYLDMAIKVQIQKIDKESDEIGGTIVYDPETWQKLQNALLENSSIQFSLHLNEKKMGPILIVELATRSVRSGLDMGALRDTYPNDFLPEHSTIALFLWQEKEQRNKVVTRPTGNNANPSDVVLFPDDEVEILDEQGEHYYVRISKSQVSGGNDFSGEQGWLRRDYLDY